ncbi:hypothetical protein JMJ77_0007791, partial [Colletotrichum scovillei]
MQDAGGRPPIRDVAQDVLLVKVRGTAKKLAAPASGKLKVLSFVAAQEEKG